MRSITKSALKKIVAQRDEAKLLGFDKVAKQLSEQIAGNQVREDSAGYVYDYNDLKTEVENSLWDMAVRAQDYCGKIVDARDINDIVERYAEEFISAIKVSTGTVVGPYEKPVLGENDDLEVSLDG